MELIHLELENGLREPDWDAMLVRLAVMPGVSQLEGDQPRNADALHVTSDGHHYSRGYVTTMLAYLEQAWEGDVSDGIRLVVANCECLFVPTYGDEENGDHRSSRLQSTVRTLKESFPGLLMAGGFSVG